MYFFQIYFGLPFCFLVIKQSAINKLASNAIAYLQASKNIWIHNLYTSHNNFDSCTSNFLTFLHKFLLSVMKQDNYNKIKFKKISKFGCRLSSSRSLTTSFIWPQYFPYRQSLQLHYLNFLFRVNLINV